MNTKTNNNLVSFRLPVEHLRELNRLAAASGKTTGPFVRDIVTSHLMDFGKLQEINHRVANIERTGDFLTEQLEQLQHQQNAATKEVATAVNELRASLASATVRLLIDLAQMPCEEAIEWAKTIFNVEQ